MNQLEKIWKDPVGSKLIAAAIIAVASPAILYFWSVAKQISYKESLFIVMGLFNIKITAPLWSLLLTAFLVLILLLYRKDKTKENPLRSDQIIQKVRSRPSENVDTKKEHSLSEEKNNSTVEEEEKSSFIGTASTVLGVFKILCH